MTPEFKKLSLKNVRNEKATYGIAELKDFIDFEAKRVYFIENCREDTGQHCHKVEKELFIMAKGSCIAVIDRGRGEGKEDVLLQSPGDAIYVGNYVWHGFKNFSPDAVLVAVSSTNYAPDRSDYIEDYEEYKKLCQKF